MSKTPFAKKKVSFLVLGNFRWNRSFYSASWFTLFWAPKNFRPEQIVCTKMRVLFSLPDTNSVRQFLLKFHIFHLSIFWWPPLKIPMFIGFFCLFPFFPCFSVSNIKKTKTKYAIFFSNLIFDIPTILQKHYFGTMWHYSCFKHAQKHFKHGKQWKLGPVFNTTLGPVFNTKTPKSWTSFWLYSIYIYML